MLKLLKMYEYPCLHTVSLQMHIVHYSTKFRTIQEAVGSRNGLAVLAFFFEVGHVSIDF